MRLDSSSQQGDLLSSHYSSVLAGPDSSLYASSIAGGVLRILHSGERNFLSSGWPAGASVNRLQMINNDLYACTDHGLFIFRNETWFATDIAIPCYQLRERGGFGYAATRYGLWSGAADHWEPYALNETAVYDFLSLPHYLIAAHQNGISFYDRYQDSWGNLYDEGGVSGLAAFHNHLIGAGNNGELLIGNKRGGLHGYRFGKLFITALRMNSNGVFVCSDRGLFRLSYFGEQIQLLSVMGGMLVTDVDQQEDRIYIATMFDGIQTLNR